MSSKKSSSKKELQIGYRITKIHSIKFGFKDISNEEVQVLFDSEDALNVNISVAVNINKEKSNITIDVSSDLIDNRDGSILINHTGRTIFYIQGLENAFNKETNTFNLPNSLLIQINGIAYTHSRALLATEISPTCYHEKYFLPVIDPSQLITNLKHG